MKDVHTKPGISLRNLFLDSQISPKQACGNRKSSGILEYFTENDFEERF